MLDRLRFGVILCMRKKLKRKKCLHCNNEWSRPEKQYCNNQCQALHKRYILIDQWKKGLLVGHTGCRVKNFIRFYLYEKHNDSCCKCGWNKKHPVTDSVPLEVHHIDGNAFNNSENNLELLCPNCHSLTPTHRNLNKGKGRKNRY